MGDLVSIAAPIAGAYFGGPAGAQIGATLGGALAGGQQVNDANQRYQQAQQASQFRPVGVTTTFGTTKYGYDDQGRLTDAGYTLSPQLQAYQNQLAGMTGTGLMQGQQIQSLAGQYLGESPEAVRQRVMKQRMDLLAPSRERELAKVLNTNYQLGTGGLSVGATGIRPGGGEGLKAANPRLEAYYNSIAQADLQSALDAETAAQNQIKFGQGLMTDAYDPFKAGLSAQQGVETMGRGALDLGLKVGGQVTQGAQAGADYLTQQQNPYLYGAGQLLGNQQLISGIGGMFGNSSPVTTGDTSAFDYAFGGGGWY